MANFNYFNKKCHPLYTCLFAGNEGMIDNREGGKLTALRVCVRVGLALNIFSHASMTSMKYLPHCFI